MRARRPLALLATSVGASCSLLLAACGTTVTTDAAAGGVGVGAPASTDASPPLGDGLALPGQPTAGGLAEPTAGLAQSRPTSDVAPAGATGVAQPASQGFRAPVVAAPRAAGAASPRVQGVTDTTVKVGFIGLDEASAGSAMAAFGGTAPQANTRAQMESIVEWINKRGGIAGRKIVPVYAERKAADADGNADTSRCTRFTQDEKVFAVVADFVGSAVACYAKARTLLLVDNQVLSARTDYAALSPYVWNPGLPTAEGGYQALFDGLIAQGYFAKDSKLGMVMYDDPATHHAYDHIVVPALRSINYKVTDPVFITRPRSTSDNGEWAAQIHNAQLKFRTHGVDRVVFMMPGGGAPVVFMNQAESQGYRPVYGLSSYDGPGFLLQGKIPDAQLRGSMGAGFQQMVDVDQQRSDPYPSGRAEIQCQQAVASSGTQAKTRPEAFAGEYLCDGAFLLQAAAQGLGSALSVPSWAAAAERLGRSFQATYSLPGGTVFGPGLRAGGGSYRYLRFLDDCRCFRYTSKNRPIPQ